MRGHLVQRYEGTGSIVDAFVQQRGYAYQAYTERADAPRR
jgi:hypothetical protein